MRNKISGHLEYLKHITKGMNFPLPPINNENLMSIACAISDAYNAISKTPSFATLDEDGITSLLQHELNGMLNGDTAIGYYIDYFARSESVVNYNATSINLKPDLTAIRANKSFRHFPITIEAKIIDFQSHWIRKYFESGIKRYIHGDYSWYYREAFMIAFVRDKSTVMSKLLPYLETKGKKFVVSLPTQVTGFEGDLAVSVHPRSFEYVLHPHNRPGPITILNLWLNK